LIECEQIESLLGNQGVTESNMMTYMGLIEQRINEIMQARSYLNQDSFRLSEKDTDRDKFIEGKRLSDEEEEEEEEEDEDDEDFAKPMGIEEFKARVMGKT